MVIDRGGQPELVRDNVDGFLWGNIDELVNFTRTVIVDRNIRERLSKTAIKSAERFNEDRFRERLLTLVASMESS